MVPAHSAAWSMSTCMHKAWRCSPVKQGCAKQLCPTIGQQRMWLWCCGAAVSPVRKFESRRKLFIRPKSTPLGRQWSCTDHHRKYPAPHKDWMLKFQPYHLEIGLVRAQRQLILPHRSSCYCRATAYLGLSSRSILAAMSLQTCKRLLQGPPVPTMHQHILCKCKLS